MVLSRDRRTSRKILTTEGYVEYERYRLYAVNTSEFKDSIERCIAYYGDKSVYPMDIYLGIDKLPFKATADAALRIARFGATAPSYKEASIRLREDFDLRISDNQIRDVVDYIGEIVLAEDIRLTKESISAYNPSKIRSARPGRRPNKGFILYCEVDGAMFNTRGSKASRADKNVEATSDTELSYWKENKLGIVFRSDSLIETTEKDDEGRPVFRIGSREYICTTQGVDIFRERLLHIMIRNGLEDASDVVIISDGAPWIRKTREKYFPASTQILDLFHLKENVMKFAQYIHGNSKSQYYPWWKSVCQQLENGLWKEVLERPEIAVYKEEKDTPSGIVNLYQYIWNNKDFIDYPAYKSKGYFVGSGAIESGNKTVLQQRLKLAGMRWYLESAESLLALRAKLKSDLWDECVTPLVHKKYSTQHMLETSIRQEQRMKHKKSAKST